MPWDQMAGTKIHSYVLFVLIAINAFSPCLSNIFFSSSDFFFRTRIKSELFPPKTFKVFVVNSTNVSSYLLPLSQCLAYRRSLLKFVERMNSQMNKSMNEFYSLVGD